jgi:hypothetical protein
VTTATAMSSLELAIDPDTVWTLIGGFGALRDWLPNFAVCELHEGGRTRHLTTTSGDKLVERLLAFDDAGRSYSYGVVESPFPVNVPWSTVKVLPQPDGPGSRIEWSGEYTAQGVSDTEAAQMVQRIYDDGLAALAAHYAALPR